MKPRKGDHVVFNAGTATLRCLHCGQDYKPTLPAPVSVFVAIARAFISTHRYCRRRDPDPAPHA